MPRIHGNSVTGRVMAQRGAISRRGNVIMKAKAKDEDLETVEEAFDLVESKSSKKQKQKELDEIMADYKVPKFKEFKYDVSHLHEEDFESEERLEEETEALKYHAFPTPGKYTITPSKVMATP